MSESYTLYYHPRACSLAVHIAMEESGLEYQRRLINVQTGQNQSSEYLAINPKGSVPALAVGDQVLTETHAILTYIADMVPQKQLLPLVGDFNRYRAHEWMNFLSSSVHPAIRSIFRPSAYAGDDERASAQVAEQGLAKLAEVTLQVESKLDGKEWALGDHFSVVDGYLFVMYLWTTDERIESVPARPNWDQLGQRIWQRPAVQRVVAEERKSRNYPVPNHWTPL